jgi:Carbohydrate binding domain
MERMWFALRRRGLLTTALLAAAACSEKAAEPTPGAAGALSCVTGERGCECYRNQTCNRGLRCEENLCGVDVGSGGSPDDTSGVAGESAGGGRPDAGSGGGGAVSGAATGEAGDANGGSAGGQPLGGSTSAGAGGDDSDVPGNMISNGSFDAELEDWVANPDIGDITSDGTKGRVCFTTNSSGQFTLAWPSDFSLAFTIKPGKSYRLSYRAVSTLGIQISVQVRQPSSPYTYYVNERETLTQTWAAHAHTFNLSSGGSNRGIAFIGSMSSSGTTCFDDVVLESLP